VGIVTYPILVRVDRRRAERRAEAARAAAGPPAEGTAGGQLISPSAG